MVTQRRKRKTSRVTRVRRRVSKSRAGKYYKRRIRPKIPTLNMTQTMLGIWMFLFPFIYTDTRSLTESLMTRIKKYKGTEQIQAVTFAVKKLATNWMFWVTWVGVPALYGMAKKSLGRFTRPVNVMGLAKVKVL